ncbi:lipopolysaccharide biosynthesis protein [Sphingobacterium suaedae]|uniref:Lipopolysaccharide biosynthesis protein n=1 Tax=Sphingobacterium suaedae TaxID=1686402 RepID=A0ABW5KMG6_9SPHI
MSGNRTIAKNTIYLYCRMLLTMGIALYTSRAVLQTLGVRDFGVYNLVGGVVVLFSFLNNAMSSSTQRFLNIGIASKDSKRVGQIFSMSLNIHFLIAITILVLSEIVGLWLLNHQLNIPKERLLAANLVFQFSIATTFVGVLKVPYDAIILARERMSFYAVVGIIQAVARLAIVMSISMSITQDRLIVYAFLMMILDVFSSIAFFVYCKLNFGYQVHYRFEKSKELFRSLISFSSWSLLGQVSVVGSSQGMGMILNVFAGVVVNAALGIAGQVSGAVYNFISSAQMAFNPQIVQTYAENKHERHVKLVLQASRFSFFLFAILCIPVLLGTDYILTLWLGANYPQYSVGFTRLIILTSVLTSLAGPLWMSAYAVGNIKRYQFCVAAVNLAVLPIAYLVMLYKRDPFLVMGAKLLLDMLLLIFRVYYFKSRLLIKNSVLMLYVRRILPLFVMVFALAPLSEFISINGLGDLLIYSLCCEAVVCGYVFFWGLRRSEVANILTLVKSKIFGLT